MPTHTAAAASSLQELKHQLVRDTIWAAAMDLFSQKGFDETTVDDIAQAAGISRRSFFRYFASKSDLMSHSMVNYAAELTAAIDACPRGYSLSRVFRETVRQVARKSAAHPFTPRIMAIVARYPEARAAELSRLAEVEDRVAEAFARRGRTRSRDDMAPSLLAGLTLHVLGVAFQTWFEQGQPDISAVVDRVFATLGRLVGEED